MPLIATPSAANANSYATVARAKVLLNERLDAVDWIAAPEVEQEQSLIWATQLLEEKTTWQGAPTTTTQALWWPVSDAYDLHDMLLSSMAIPVFLERATAVYGLALWQYSKHARDERVTRMEIGPVNLDFAPGNAAPQDAMPAEVRRMLVPYGVVIGAGGMLPVLRV